MPNENDRCNCSCADICPLGKTGIEPRCTLAELEKFRNDNEQQYIELTKKVKNSIEAYQEMIMLMFESLERIALKRSPDPALDAYKTITGASMMFERELK